MPLPNSRPAKILRGATTLFLALALTATAIAQSPPAAQSWKVWGGPTADFIIPAPPLAATWPAAGPRRIWQRPLGEGYSSIAVEGNTLYTMYQRPASFWQIFTYDQEVVAALNAATGETIWEFPYDAPFSAAYPESGDGPRAMPVIVGNLVVTAGATGKIHALDKRSGKLVWRHDLYEEFGAARMPHGYSSHPVPYKDSLIVLAGGSKGAVLSLKPSTGEVIWAKLDFENAHSTPLLINVDGQDQMAAFTARSIIGFDPATGERLWSYPHTTEYGLAVSTPVWAPEEGILVFASAYGYGTTALQLSRSGAKTDAKKLWHESRMQLHFGSMIRLADTLYLSSGHSGPAFLCALDLKTGEILWRERGFAKASLLHADGKFLIADENGMLALASAGRKGLKVLAKSEILQPNAWTVPTLVGSTLYIRDRHDIMALDLAGR